MAALHRRGNAPQQEPAPRRSRQSVGRGRRV